MHIVSRYPTVKLEAMFAIKRIDIPIDRERNPSTWILFSFRFGVEIKMEATTIVAAKNIEKVVNRESERFAFV